MSVLDTFHLSRRTGLLKAAPKPRGRTAACGNLLPQQLQRGLLWVLRTTQEVLWGHSRHLLPWDRVWELWGQPLLLQEVGVLNPTSRGLQSSSVRVETQATSPRFRAHAH